MDKKKHSKLNQSWQMEELLEEDCVEEGLLYFEYNSTQNT
jgi:hypothetical protein